MFVSIYIIKWKIPYILEERSRARVCVWERNVLANNDFRLRCDTRRSFRRAIRGEFLDAAIFLSTRCFSRTFSKFGSEAGQFFSRLLVGQCHTEEGVGEERGMDGRQERDAKVPQVKITARKKF